MIIGGSAVDKGSSISGAVTAFLRGLFPRVLIFELDAPPGDCARSASGWDR
jgi:hypothetical protein